MKLNDVLKEAYRSSDREAFNKRFDGGMPISDRWKVGDKMLPTGEADEYVTKRLLNVLPKEKEKELQSMSVEEKLRMAKKLGLKL